MKPLARSALLFTAIGLALYAALYAAADRLVYATGHANPIFKIAAARHRDLDWVILGASHAMPLDFADSNATIERATGRRVLNLAAPGTGPLYQRFVLEEFVEGHRARRLLYLADSFAFRSAQWNEARFGDAKLLRRTPFRLATAARLGRYVRREGVDPLALLDYTSGFSKLNDRTRFARDAWEGEAQFERVQRPSASAVAKRIEYLYPGPASPAELERYLGELGELLDVARAHGIEPAVAKMPLPDAFRARLPEEAAFDAALAKLLAARGVALHDFSGSIGEARFYFDTDHLNRAGLARFVERDLGPLLAGGALPASSMNPDGGAEHRRHRPRLLAAIP